MNDDARFQDLTRRLAEAEQTLRAIFSGQADAVVYPVSGTPLLLHQAQEALLESEARYRGLVTHMSALVFEATPDGTLVFVNEALTPITGYRPEEMLGQNWRNLVLPALTLGAFAMASIARLTRSAVLEVLGADYIRTARAKGVSEVWVVAKHTLKNAAIPIVTITGLQFGTLLGGAVVTETVFSWPGIGRLAVQSIYNRDYPVVQCTVFVAALLFIIINFAVDLVYGFLDPRIRAH